MRRFWIIIGIIPIFLSCVQEPEKETRFDRSKWLVKEGKDYPYRPEMLKDVVYNDTVRSLSKEEVLKLFGEPDRSQDNHLYYRIDQTRFWNWPMHTQTMVIRINEKDSIDWIKIHE